MKIYPSIDKLVKKRFLLLINPWIYDFAAYNFWSQPLGLLQVGSFLASKGYHVAFIDCLSPEDGQSLPFKQDGRSKFKREVLPRPLTLKDIERRWARYGISIDSFMTYIDNIPEPSAALITCVMTYWYPGVLEVRYLLKKKWPDLPIIIGGIYPTLCTKHARDTFPNDLIFQGNDLGRLLNILSDLSIEPSDKTFSLPDTWSAYYLLKNPSFLAILTSKGCPFSCTYCASHALYSGFIRRDPDDVADEILYWYKRLRVKNFAFYDDALLINSEKHLIPILEKIIRLGIDINFHTPNGLHAREVTKDIARILFYAGFSTIRIGFEMVRNESSYKFDQKVSNEDFSRAVLYLKKAGFRSEQLGAYVLYGLPGQTVAEVEDSIKFVKSHGIRPYLSEYSPIPKTALWEKARECARWDIENEPLYQNNTLLACAHSSLTRNTIQYLKKLSRETK